MLNSETRGLFSDVQVSHSRKMQILHLYLVLWLIWLGTGKKGKKKSHEIIALFIILFLADSIA